MTIPDRKPALRMVFGPREHLSSGIGGYATNLMRLLSTEYATELKAIPFRPRSAARYFYQFIVLPMKCIWWRLHGFEIVLCDEGLLFLIAFTGRYGYVVIHHAPTLGARVENLPGRLKSLLLRKWLRLAPLARAVICPSEVTAHELSVAFGVRNIKVIPNLFDFGVLEAAARQSRSKGFGRESYYLMVASDESRKRIDIAIRALSLIPEHVRPALVKIGAPMDKTKRAFLERLAREKQVDVTFHDRVDIATLVSRYKNAEALLCTSSVEGFCRPIIEAQFFGLPIIATDLPVLREVAGVNGALFISSGSEPAEQGFRDAMALLSGSPKLRKELIRAGQQNWKRFDVAMYSLTNW